ncbi:MAG: Nucleotidyl transferase [Parcubacteria group bacterium GW2011_GWA2_47_12]|nr:MAG: Nucleotidyl transferase [Parcubacteria group bacterium GW2011_GWA2_47_12]
MNALKNIPIIVLCGGQGTRLRSVVSDRPKVLAPLGTQTLLDSIIAMLRKAGFKKIILSVGYLKEQVKRYCEKRGYQVIFSEEDEPLGTGGAVKAALQHITSNLFFVMNGDTIFNPDFSELYQFHKEKKGFMSMLITRGYKGDGGDVVTTNKNQRIIQWRKKTQYEQPETLHLNTGTYLMKKEIARFFPNKKSFSLENDVFPVLFAESCYGYKTDELFIDIGVPERYALAREQDKTRAASKQ